MNPKKVYVTVLLLFNMSSCRKPEIQNDLAKITNFYLTNSGHKCLFLHILTTFQLNSKHNETQWDSNSHSLVFEATEHLRNRMRKENCRKRL